MDYCDGSIVSGGFDGRVLIWKMDRLEEDVSCNESGLIEIERGERVECVALGSKSDLAVGLQSGEI